MKNVAFGTYPAAVNRAAGALCGEVITSPRTPHRDARQAHAHRPIPPLPPLPFVPSRLVFSSSSSCSCPCAWPRRGRRRWVNLRRKSDIRSTPLPPRDTHRTIITENAIPRTYLTHVKLPVTLLITYLFYTQYNNAMSTSLPKTLPNP
jgi:hypothetical protein